MTNKHHFTSRAASNDTGDNLETSAEPTQPTLFIQSAASASRRGAGGCHNTPSKMALILSTLHSITHPPRWVNSPGGLSSFGVCLYWDPDIKRGRGRDGAPSPRRGRRRPSRGSSERPAGLFGERSLRTDHYGQALCRWCLLVTVVPLKGCLG